MENGDGDGEEDLRWFADADSKEFKYCSAGYARLLTQIHTTFDDKTMSEDARTMLREVMKEKPAVTNATLATAQEFAKDPAAAAASSHTQLSTTVTEMNDSMKLIQKDIEVMKKKIDQLEDKLRSVKTTADEGLALAKPGDALTVL